MLAGGVLGRIRRTVDAEFVEDRLHDVAVTVLQAIRDGTLREPDHLMGFVSTVTRRRLAKDIRTNVAARRRIVAMEPADFPAPAAASPEAGVVESEQARSLRRALLRLRPRDREILMRFYVHEQGPEEICEAMGLTTTQFRLFKSRAIARCAACAGTGAARRFR